MYMDDNQNNDKNQFETPQPLQPEEVAADIQSPDEIRGNISDSFAEVPVYEEKQNKWKLFAAIGGVFVVIFGLIIWFFFRGNETPANPIAPAKKAVTLTYWGLWDEEAIFKPVFDAYMKKNKHVTIKYEKMAPDQYRERLLARSKTGNGPDIFRFHNTWVPEIKEVLTKIPDTTMSKKDFESTFYPVHAKDLNIDGNYYGLPFMIDGSVLIYNDTLLKQAGLEIPPSCWVCDNNDVFSAANKLTVRDNENNIVTSGIALGTASNIEHYGEAFGVLLLLNGGDLTKLDKPEAAESLGIYRKFAEDNYWSEAMPNSISAFIEGKAAMIIAPSWHVINIKAQNPELQVKVAPVPRGLTNTSISVSNYWVEGVNINSKNQVEAWNLLSFMIQKENLAAIYKAQAEKRAFGIIYSRRDMADLLKDNPYLYPVIQTAQEDGFVSLPLVTRTYDNGLNDDILQYIQDAINSTENGVSYESALSTASRGIKQVYERYKIQ